MWAFSQLGNSTNLDTCSVELLHMKYCKKQWNGVLEWTAEERRISDLDDEKIWTKMNECNYRLKKRVIV